MDVRWLQLITLLLALAAFTRMACQAPPEPTRTTSPSLRLERISSLDPAKAGGPSAASFSCSVPWVIRSIDLDEDGMADWKLVSRHLHLLISPDGLHGDGSRCERMFSFHDGTPLQRRSHGLQPASFPPKSAPSATSLEIGSRQSKSLTVYTLRLRLSRPSTSLEGLLTSVNLTPDLPERPTAITSDKFLNDRFVGTGPYRLTRLQRTAAATRAI